MTPDDALARLALARRLYGVACAGGILLGPSGLAVLLAPLPPYHPRRAALRERVRELERAVNAEKVRAAIRAAKGNGRRANA